MSALKKCPYCAEEIQEEAVKCRFCGEFLDGSKRPEVTGDPLPLYLRTSFIVVTFLILPPVALPLIWLHPRIHLAWKVVLTVVIGAFSWMSYTAYQGAIKELDAAMEMMDEI
ncbi:MAG: hypothetical protein OSA93_12710 [Akkermansiaceae bacterium]|nr:hypothetical protein [Akkermansiaceae bacterium]